MYCREEGRVQVKLPSFLRQAGHRLGGTSSLALLTAGATVPVVSALLSQPGPCSFCGCLAADGAERNVDLSALGLPFPGARMPL